MNISIDCGNASAEHVVRAAENDTFHFSRLVILLWQSHNQAAMIKISSSSEKAETI